MFATWPILIRLPLVLAIFVVSTVLHVTPLLLLAVAKALIPIAAVRRRIGRGLEAIAESWIAVNSAMIDGFTHTQVIVTGVESLVRDRTYLVLANHLSWVDIPILQKALNRRIPLLRFFLKRQLFWVPVLGLAWWALDFPFMRRHSREQIAANPDLARSDIEATRRACARYRGSPVSVMNFVEGTRATPGKRAASGSEYRHLLRPKAGGVAFVIGAMGDVLDEVLDLTVVYPGGTASLWEFFRGDLAEARVDVRRRPIPDDLRDGDYENDPEYRARFQSWLNRIWHDKDAWIAGQSASQS